MLLCVFTLNVKSEIDSVSDQLQKSWVGIAAKWSYSPIQVRCMGRLWCVVWQEKSSIQHVLVNAGSNFWLKPSSVQKIPRTSATIVRRATPLEMVFFSHWGLLVSQNTKSRTCPMGLWWCQPHPTELMPDFSQSQDTWCCLKIICIMHLLKQHVQSTKFTFKQFWGPIRNSHPQQPVVSDVECSSQRQEEAFWRRDVEQRPPLDIHHSSCHA